VSVLVVRVGSSLSALSLRVSEFGDLALLWKLNVLLSAHIIYAVYKQKIILNVGTIEYSNEFFKSITCKSII
jgi:hypothetical protein